MSTGVVEAVAGVHGGVKFYRGAAKAARAYVERDRSRADDYYLGDGALHPQISTALDAAQDRAAAEIVGWVAQHATTRVGPRDRQVRVPVERIEAAVVRHYTSRAGDPHRHLHLQINARVWAVGAWRGIHSVGIRDSIEAINGIGHAAVVADPQFRAVLARHGFILDPESGEIRELAPYVGAFSARTAQIRRNVDRYEGAWRSEHPGVEPGRRLREAWDRRAWAQARPGKVVPTDGRELVDRWNASCGALGTFGNISTKKTGDRWRARTRFRDYDGQVRDVVRFGLSENKAITHVKVALAGRTGTVATSRISWSGGSPRSRRTTISLRRPGPGMRYWGAAPSHPGWAACDCPR